MNLYEAMEEGRKHAAWTTTDIYDPHTNRACALGLAAIGAGYRPWQDITNLGWGHPDKAAQWVGAFNDGIDAAIVAYLNDSSSDYQEAVAKLRGRGLLDIEVPKPTDAE
jgi:hypothetical protein